MRLHRHDANEQNPLREARLLYFANGNTGASEQPDDPLETHVTFGAEGMAPDGQPPHAESPRSEPVEAIQDATREGVAASTNTDDPLRTHVSYAAEGNTPREQPEGGEENRSSNAGAAKTSEGAGTAEAAKLLSPDTVYENCEKLVHRINGMMEKVKEILQMLRTVPSSTAVKSAQENWRDLYEQLQAQQGPLRTARDMATKLREWKSGKVPPPDFLDWLKKHRAGSEAHTDDTSGAQDPSLQRAYKLLQESAQHKEPDPTGEHFPDATSAEDWDTYHELHNASTRNVAIEQLSNAADIQRELQDIDRYTSTLDKALDNMSVDKQADAARDELESFLSSKKSQEDGTVWLKLEWYSLRDIYFGAKGWWDSYKNAWEQRAKLRQGRIQHKVSRMFEWLPLGEQAYREGQRNLDSEHRKQKDEYVEDLRARKPLFLDLFGPNKEFRKAFQSDQPDKAMAILEYAAERGWLYMLKQDYEVDGYRLLDLDGVFPSHWERTRRDIYLDNLVGQQQSGYTKERNETKESIEKKYEVVDGFLKEFTEYMKNVNFGAAQGVMEAMYARAITGEEGPHIAAAFFKVIREKPQIQQYLTAVILQDFSRLSLGKGYLTMTNLFLDRTPMSKFTVKEKLNDNMEKSGNLPKLIALAEKRITSLSPAPLSADDMAKHVSKFIGGHPVKLDRGTCSIWEKQFEFYRNPALNNAIVFADKDSVKGTALDYFASEDNFELLLVGEPFIKELFHTDSPQQWVNEDRVTNFVGKVKLAYEKLLETYKGTRFADPNDHPAIIFRTHLGSKIQQAMNENIDRSSQIMSVKLRVGNKSDPDLGAVATLQAMGFIKLEEMGTVTDPKLGERYRDAIQGDVDRIKAKLPLAPDEQQTSPRSDNRNTSSTPTRQNQTAA